MTKTFEGYTERELKAEHRKKIRSDPSHPANKIMDKLGLEYKDQEQKIVYNVQDKRKSYLQIVESILKKESIITLLDDGDMYLYQNGIYVPGARKRIPPMVNLLVLNYHDISKFGMKEIIDLIERETSKTREQITPSNNLLCVKNGILDIETRQLQPHTPDIVFFRLLPVKFDPEATCPKIKKFIEEVYPDNPLMLWEVAAYGLWPEYPIQKASILWGEGGNGKSTYSELVRKLFGKENTSTISLQELCNNRFAAQELYNKFINIYPEMPSSHLVDSSKFKAATGGDELMGERKFKDRFSFKNSAKFIFSTNRIPSTSDNSRAYFRRINLLPFTQVFHGESDDQGMLDSLSTEGEMSGFLNECLRVLPDLLERKDFFNALSVEATAELYKKMSDSVYAFIVDCVECDYHGVVVKKDLFNIYTKYCLGEGFVPVSESGFFKSIRKYIPLEDYRQNIMGSRLSSFKGLKIHSKWSGKSNVFPILRDYSDNNNKVRGKLDSLDQKTIIRYLKQNPEVSVDKIFQDFEKQDSKKIYSIMGELMNQGLIFSPRPGVFSLVVKVVD